MKAFWRLFAALAFAAAASPGQAGGGDVFVVAPVKVDVTAESALEARSQALPIGQAKAWGRLLARLTLPDDIAALAPASVDELATLVKGYEVLRERISPVRYLAELSVTFDRDSVRGWLSRNGIAFAETPSRPVLVIPVLIGSEHAVLWEDPNGWRDAWQNLPPQDGLVPIIVPYGDIADIRDLTTLQAMQGDAAALNAIATRYDAGAVVVAEATWYADDQTGLPVLELVYRRIADEPGPETPLIVLSGKHPEGLPGMFADGVIEIVNSVVSLWKQANLVEPGLESRVTAAVPIRDFQHWLSVRRRLSEIGILGRSELLRLTRREARVDLWVHGDVAQLRNALIQHDLTLHDGRLDYVLTDRGSPVPETQRPAAPAAPPPAAPPPATPPPATPPPSAPAAPPPAAPVAPPPSAPVVGR